MDAEAWNRKHAAGDHHFGGEPDRFLVAEVAELPAGRALDLACGSGRNAVWLAERGWQVTGVDFSETAIANARQLASERGAEVELVVADVLEWEPPAASFDLVTLVYPHLPSAQRARVLARAASVLAPGGRIVVVGHHTDNIEDGVGGPQDPDVLFSAEDVVAELPRLEVEKEERVLRETDEGTAIDALVHVMRLPTT